MVRRFRQNAFAVFDRQAAGRGLEAVERGLVELVGLGDDRRVVYEAVVFQRRRRFRFGDAFDVHDPLAHLRAVDGVGHQAQERLVDFGRLDVAVHRAQRKAQHIMGRGVERREADRFFEMFDAFLKLLLAHENLAQRRVRFAVFGVDFDRLRRDTQRLFKISGCEFVEAFFNQRNLAVLFFERKRLAGQADRRGRQRRNVERALLAGHLRHVRREFPRKLRRRSRLRLCGIGVLARVDGLHHIGIAGRGFPRRHLFDFRRRFGRSLMNGNAADGLRRGEAQLGRRIQAIFGQHRIDPAVDPFAFFDIRLQIEEAPVRRSGFELLPRRRSTKPRLLYASP